MPRPSKANAAAATTYAGRQESLATSAAPTSGGPSEAPIAHAACSPLMNRISPRSAASVFTVASSRPTPQPSTAEARMVADHPLAIANRPRPPHAAATERRRSAIVPRRSRTRPLAALAANCATVIPATSSPSPAKGASREARIDGQAMPSIPAGSPRKTRPMNAIAAARRRTRTCKGYGFRVSESARFVPGRYDAAGDGELSSSHIYRGRALMLRRTSLAVSATLIIVALTAVPASTSSPGVGNVPQGTQSDRAYAKSGADRVTNVLATTQRTSCYTPEVPFFTSLFPANGYDGMTGCAGVNTGEDLGPYPTQAGSNPGYPAANPMLVKDHSESDIRIDPTNPNHLIGQSKWFVSGEGYNHLLGFYESMDEARPGRSRDTYPDTRVGPTTPTRSARSINTGISTRSFCRISSSTKTTPTTSRSTRTASRIRRWQPR